MDPNDGKKNSAAPCTSSGSFSHDFGARLFGVFCTACQLEELFFAKPLHFAHFYFKEVSSSNKIEIATIVMDH